MLTAEHRTAAAIPSVTLALTQRADALALEPVQPHVSAKPEPTPSSINERIAAALADADRPRPFAEILRACCRVRTATLYAHLAAMTATGRIVKTGDSYRLAGH